MILTSVFFHNWSTFTLIFVSFYFFYFLFTFSLIILMSPIRMSSKPNSNPFSWFLLVHQRWTASGWSWHICNNNFTVANPSSRTIPSLAHFSRNANKSFRKNSAWLSSTWGTTHLTSRRLATVIHQIWNTEKRNSPTRKENQNLFEMIDESKKFAMNYWHT